MDAPCAQLRRRCMSAFWLPAVLSWAMALTGCQQQSSLMAVSSKLEGAWAAMRTPENVSPQASVWIRADGTFDLSRTVLRMLGDVGYLQYPGQSLTTKIAGGGRIEVLRGEYSPTHSLLVIRVRATDEHGRSDEGIQAYAADFNEDGTMADREGRVRSSSSPLDDLSPTVFRRIGPFPDEAAERAADEAEWGYLHRVEIRSATTSGGDRFCLVLPKEGPTPNRMVVTLGSISDSDEAINGEAESWFWHVDKNQIVVLVPGINIMKCHYEKKLNVNRPLLLADAPRVLAMVEKARSSLGVEKVYLLASGFGGYLGHYVWTTDNRPFSGFMAQDVESYDAYPAPLDFVDRAKPVHIWSSDPRQGGSARIAAWYRGLGFTAIDARTMPDAWSDPRQYLQDCLLALFEEAQPQPAAPSPEPSTQPSTTPPAGDRRS